MGHCSSIALGIAIAQPSRQVVCIDGDGALLMHMGNMAIIGQSNSNNFIHIVLNNGAHDSVGGQPTVGYSVDFQGIAKASGYSLVMQAITSKEVETQMTKLQKYKGTALLEIVVKKGFRQNLGRPTATPVENKNLLIGFIKGNYE